MPLATQCPHCFTTFRVANDQLKLHAGLVRCGACRQTFNGVEHLLAPGAKPAPAKSAEAPDLPAHEPTRSPAYLPTHLPTHLPIHVALPDELEFPRSEIPDDTEILADTKTQDQSVSAPAEVVQETGPAPSSSSLDFDLGQDEAFAASAAAPPEPPAPEVDGFEINEFKVDESDAQSETAEFNTEQNDAEDLETQQDLNTIESAEQEAIKPSAEAEDAIPEATALAENETSEGDGQEARDEASDEAEDEGEPDSEKPIFVIQAEKKQRRSRITKLFLRLSSLILCLALLAQASYSLRHQIAAWFPQTKPALQEACKLLHCRIEMPAQIDMVLIVSSELQTMGDEGKVFSLAVLLQNTSATLQSWPLLELTLNDSKERTVLRRAFKPTEYLANKNDLIKGFAPASEQPITLYFELSEVKAAGYHVSVFYP